MIVSIGMADRNNKAYKLVQHLSKLNAPVSFLAPFSQNPDHIQLLEEIIDQCILFDPVFCNTKGEIEDITFERLNTAFSANSDIEFVCIEKGLYENKKVKEAVDNSMQTLDAKLVIFKEEDCVQSIADTCLNG